MLSGHQYRASAILEAKNRIFNKIVKKLLDFHIQVGYTSSRNGVVMKGLAYQSVIALIKVLQKSPLPNFEEEWDTKRYMPAKQGVVSILLAILCFFRLKTF